MILESLVTWGTIATWLKNCFNHFRGYHIIAGLHDNITDIEDSFKNANKYKIGLSFFDYGDKDVEEQIVNAIKNQSVIHVKAPSREEGLYCVLRLIRKNNFDKVLVADTVQAWQSIQDTLSNHIVIPNFVTNNEICPITGNKTVFIYSNGDYLAHPKTFIEIKPRTRQNLYKTFREYHVEDGVIESLIEKTNGIFPAIHREISIGQEPKPSWTNFVDLRKLVPAFLLCCWNECEGDRQIIVQLTEQDFYDYISMIASVMNTDDAFFISNGTNVKNYRVCEPFIAWGELSKYITLRDLQKFQEVVLKIFLNDNIAIHNTIDGITNDNCQYSGLIKKGIITILTILHLSEDDSFVYFSEETVKKILNGIHDRNETFMIIKHIRRLFEAAPKVVLNWLEDEIENEESNIWCVFPTREHPNSYDYTEILFLTEMAMLLENNVQEQGIRILLKLANKDFSYSMSNTPTATLYKLFCAWENEVAITKENKIGKIKELAKEYPKLGWDILLQVLPLSFAGQIYSPLCRPVYLITEGRLSNVSQEDAITIYRAYFEVAFKCAGNDLLKWREFFKACTFIPYGFKNKVIEYVGQLVQNTEILDEIKYQFSKVLRDFIWQQRYSEFNGYVTADDVQDIESAVFNKICYKNISYKYRYAFTENWNFHELHPVPHSCDSVNDYSEEKYIKRQRKVFDEMLADDIDIIQFIRSLDVEDDPITGINLAECVSNNNIDPNILQELFALGKYQMMTSGYLRQIVNVNGEKTIVDFCKSLEFSISDDYFKFLILSVLDITAEKIEFVCSLPETVQEQYWKNVCMNVKFNDVKFAEKCMSQVIKYHNYRVAVMWIRDNNFTVLTYMKLLRSIADNDIEAMSKLRGMYEVQPVFKKIYSCEVSKKLKNKVCQLEMMLCDAFDDRMQPKFLLEELKENPIFVAKLVSSICKKDCEIGKTNHSNLKVAQKERYISRALFKIKFCPCVNNADVDARQLLDWCAKFSAYLTEREQKKAMYCYLGQFLANSPMNQNGNWPHEAVCNAIEVYHNKIFDGNFVCEVLNSRGVYTASEGIQEQKLSEKYANFAKASKKYRHTAEILQKIANFYKRESNIEREYAVYES